MSWRVKTSAGWLAAILITSSLLGAEIKIGAVFPDLARYDLEGALPVRAGKVVLVDFWASWCAPCKASFPAYASLQRELGQRGFTVVAVSVDKHQEAYSEFVKKFGPEFSTLRDAAQKMAADLNPPVMPTSYLIDRHGVLRAQRQGFHGGRTVRELRNEIIKLLDEEP